MTTHQVVLAADGATSAIAALALQVLIQGLPKLAGTEVTINAFAIVEDATATLYTFSAICTYVS